MTDIEERFTGNGDDGSLIKRQPSAQRRGPPPRTVSSSNLIACERARRDRHDVRCWLRRDGEPCLCLFAVWPVRGSGERSSAASYRLPTPRGLRPEFLQAGN